MLREQERERLLERYSEASNQEKSQIIAKIYVLDEEEDKSDIQN